MPRNEEQRKEWQKKYGWHEEEFLETPMLPMTNIEAGCYKCHNASPEVPRAAALNSGRDLIRIYGCFGCHKIPGYENIRKVGPDLSTVSGKLTKEWVRKWLANPKDFKSAGAHAAVLVEQQQQRRPTYELSIGINAMPPRSTPSPNICGRSPKPKQLPCRAAPAEIRATGKQIVETVGCFGCHAVGPIQEVANQSQIRRRHGYNLANQGSKVTAILDLQLGQRSRSGLARYQDAEFAADR